MKKTLISIFISLFVLVLHKIAITYSSVPPAERTGAPGETSCYTSGCHTLGTLNPPQGSISILFNNGPNNYKPDSTYNVSVTVTDSAQKIFGFELTALDSTNLRVGDFIKVDITNTYIKLSNSREYISHFNAWDSENFGAGTFTWQFQWVAPTVNVGNITFYSAGVAAASLISVPAGNVYTTALTISPDSSLINSENCLQEPVLTLFPNPADHTICFLFKEPQPQPINIILMGLNGQKVFQYSIRYDNPISIDISNIPSGLYLLKINNTFYKKVLINH